MRPNISVAMATYNGEKYIQEQLDSLAKQTVLPLELVVCDDGSKDKTLQIVRDFAAVAPFPVHIYTNETNLGYADNFLKSASKCKGSWIAFCDQDDVWFAQKLARVCDVIERYSGDELVLVGHTSLMATGDIELTGQRLPDFRRDAYVKRASNFGFFCIVGFSMIFRKVLISQVDSALRPRVYRQNPKTPPGHDQWIGMLANAVGDIAYIGEPLAIWRRHDLSLTTPPSKKRIGDETKSALQALNAEPYVLLANMAQESGESLRKISELCLSSKMKIRLMDASAKFNNLADNLFRRADLYRCFGRLQKLKVLIKMMWTNAYFGPKFNSLGWKSFVKDAIFVLGIIG